MAKGKYEEWLTKEGLTLIAGWARDGLTDEQIAHNMGISRKTLAEWKKKYGDIGDTLKKGKEIIDYEVENALLKKALGYKVTELKPTKDGELIEIEKEIPPDTAAQIFWLKNRKPEKWKDKPEETDKKQQDSEININIISANEKKGKIDDN